MLGIFCLFQTQTQDQNIHDKGKIIVQLNSLVRCGSVERNVHVNFDYDLGFLDKVKAQYTINEDINKYVYSQSKKSNKVLPPMEWL